MSVDFCDRCGEELEYEHDCIEIVLDRVNDLEARLKTLEDWVSSERDYQLEQNERL